VEDQTARNIAQVITIAVTDIQTPGAAGVSSWIFGKTKSTNKEWFNS